MSFSKTNRVKNLVKSSGLQCGKALKWAGEGIAFAHPRSTLWVLKSSDTLS